MAILNFQKPDKVIMIDSTEFEGKFEKLDKNKETYHSDMRKLLDKLKRI